MSLSPCATEDIYPPRGRGLRDAIGARLPSLFNGPCLDSAVGVGDRNVDVRLARNAVAGCVHKSHYSPNVEGCLIRRLLLVARRLRLGDPIRARGVQLGGSLAGNVSSRLS